MAAAKAPPKPLPPDAKAQVDALPPWLREVAAGAFHAVAPEGEIAKQERERAETDRLTRHTQLCDQVVWALRGGLGRSRDAAECIAALTRVLNGVEVRKAEFAVLALCESIIREAKERIRKARKPPPAGRGAP